MEWLKDRKNLPFVAAGAALLIIGSILFVLYSDGVFNRSNPTPVQPPQVAIAGNTPGAPPLGAPPPGAPLGMPPQTAPAMGSVAAKRAAFLKHKQELAAKKSKERLPASEPGTPPVAAANMMPSGAPGMPPSAEAAGMPGAPGAAAPGGTPTTTAAAPIQPINPATARDPFAVAMVPVSKKYHQIGGGIGKRLPSLLNVLPPDNIYTGVSAESQIPAADKPSAAPMGYGGNFGQNPMQGQNQMAALPRVSGILYNDGIFAIIQPVNAPSESVKPGDMISGVGKVMSIQSDGITVKLGTGQTVHIPISSGPPGGGMGGYPGGGYPGGGYRGGGPPGGYPGGGYQGGPPPGIGMGGGGYPGAPP